MYRLNLPPYPIKITERGEKRQIFDFLRRKYVALTPEEWVRQHFVHYLVEVKRYPKSLLANEVELKVGDKKLRCDTLLYTQTLQPRMIVEYKAPTIPLQQKIFDQISAYNLLLKVDYLVVSNGLQHVCCKMDYATLLSFEMVGSIPGQGTKIPQASGACKAPQPQQLSQCALQPVRHN